MVDHYNDQYDRVKCLAIKVLVQSLTAVNQIRGLLLVFFFIFLLFSLFLFANPGKKEIMGSKPGLANHSRHSMVKSVYKTLKRLI